MRYLILVSHGIFAPGLHNALGMIAGSDREDIRSTSLLDGMDVDTFRANFAELVGDITAEDEIILTADIIGGSPLTTALDVLTEKGLLARTLASMDIDGTLLDSAHRLPSANREAVQFAAKNGAAICLMSARPPRAVFPIRDALGVDGPLACCGGGLILADEKRLADSRLTRECTRAVLHETQARHIHLSVYRDLDWLIAAEDEWS